MADKCSKDSQQITRRKFLKGVGSGIVATSTVATGVESASAGNLDSNEIHMIGPGQTTIQLRVNGEEHAVTVEPRSTLLDVLRNDLVKTGTKKVCDRGECGGCSVIMNGKVVYSCLTLAVDAQGKDILTVEGLLEGEMLHPVQDAFVEKDGLQCGFCTPGQVMAAYGLLKRNPNPSKEEIREGMSGNLCRCGAYQHIFESVKSAAEKMS